MDGRDKLIDLLHTYKAWDEIEARSVAKTIQFITHEPLCFQRECQTGHITASALVINQDGTQVLLINHRKLNKWLQLGGHCDGNANTQEVALQEAYEESGLSTITMVGGIFDVELCDIPPYQAIPAHTHYDIRYLCQADDTQSLRASVRESLDIRWTSLDVFQKYFGGDGNTRIHEKLLCSRMRTH